jgi:hypothetical protein
MRKRRPHLLADTASAYVGFTARNGQTPFGQASGYNGTQFQWDGSFIDTVLKEAGYRNQPAHSHTVTALAEYTKQNRMFHHPQRGDVVFFSFSVNGQANLLAPHVGIVTDATEWRKHGKFKSVEGQVATGQPKGPTDENGVYERSRHKYDVIGFARPKKETASHRLYTEKLAVTQPQITVRPSYLLRCTTAQSTASAKPEIRRAVECVQIALSETVGLRNADRYIFNPKTQSALAEFQRTLGALNATGVPDVRTLTELAKRTHNFFRVEE